MAKRESAIFPEPERVVAVGDLEGNFDGLVTILRAAGLVNSKKGWKGGGTHLVQIGDIFGRGEKPRECCDLLRRLAREAKKAGGRVHVLVGNHEAEVVHRFEFECDASEYLDFASPAALRRWRRQRDAVAQELWHLTEAESMPMANLVGAWELIHPPGRVEVRKALAPTGSYGKWISSLPGAVQLGRLVFSHAGILPDWAHDGIDGLNGIIRRDMAKEAYFADFPESSVIMDPDGPLWSRHYAWGAKWVPAALKEVLGLFGASSMVIGHTPGRSIRARYSRRVICIDTGIGRETGKLSALVVEKDAFFALYPPKRRVKIGAVPKSVKPRSGRWRRGPDDAARSGQRSRPDDSAPKTPPGAAKRL